MTFSLRAVERVHLPVRAAGFVALVCVAILALSGWRELVARDTVLKNAQVDMSNLARSLTQHAEDTFQLADTILIGMVERLEKDGTEPAAIARLHSFLDLRKSTLPQIRGLFAYGEDGRWLLTTEKADITGYNNSDREYFQHHREVADGNTLIGRPVHSKSGGQWIITLSRRFNHSDGSFAGVALMTIDAAYFSEFYAHFDVGPHGALTLLSANGIILARSPDGASYVGRDMASSPLFQGSRPPEGTYQFTSPLDGKERLSFYKRSGRYPVMVLATRAKNDVLEPWHQQLSIRIGIVLALVALIAWLGIYIVRQLLERQGLAATLAAKEAEFRLIAEGSSDMVTRIGLDGRLMYVSPSCIRMVGWRSDQLTGTYALAGVNGEDLPKVERVVASLKCGEAEDARVSYRTRHREKGEIWIESTMHVTRRFGTDVIDGVVAISRDMTAYKDLEDRLAALATMDGLTGIANRRHFDQRLAEEWARAKRDGTPLSLLLIDVDHFKKYNDRYGHQAGDRCLQVVAGALTEVSRRPADLAARYGGEEFVLILPNTDAAGCAHVSDRFRTALRERDLPHVLNHPSQVVTVSLGGATIWPGAVHGSVDGSSLIEAADRALYCAKEAGRDRLVMAAQVVSFSHGKIAG